MTDPDWGDLDQIPQKRHGNKLLFCGLGCLIPIALLVAAGMWFKAWAEEARDPEAQWENLRALVQYDQRPPGWQMEFGLYSEWFEAGIFILFYPKGEGRIATFLQMPGDTLQDLFDTNQQDIELWTPPGSEEPLNYIEVQGRQLRLVLRDTEAGGEGERPQGGEPDPDHPMVAIDLTPVVSEELVGTKKSKPVYLLITAPPEHQMLPSEIVRFLAPFHIGPER